jgi:hypothetical protein
MAQADFVRQKGLKLSSAKLRRVFGIKNAILFIAFYASMAGITGQFSINF